MMGQAGGGGRGCLGGVTRGRLKGELFIFEGHSWDTQQQKLTLFLLRSFLRQEILNCHYLFMVYFKDLHWNLLERGLKVNSIYFQGIIALDRILSCQANRNFLIGYFKIEISKNTKIPVNLANAKPAQDF